MGSQDTENLERDHGGDIDGKQGNKDSERNTIHFPESRHLPGTEHAHIEEWTKFGDIPRKDDVPTENRSRNKKREKLIKQEEVIQEQIRYLAKRKAELKIKRLGDSEMSMEKNINPTQT